MATIKKAHKAKVKVDVIAKKLEPSLERGYKLAMESFKIEAKKNHLDEYYYRIFNIQVAPPYMRTSSRERGNEEDGPKVTAIEVRNEGH